MNNFTTIYALVDPRKGKIFYVGRTTMNLRQRLQNHIRDGRKGRTSKGVLISKILAAGLQPSMIVLAQDVMTQAEAIAAEQAWIDFYGLTCNLSNTGKAVNGGHGRNARIHWTPDMIARLGKEPDSDLAFEFGCDRKSIEFQRAKRGIPRCPQQNFSKPPFMGGWNKTDLPREIVEQMGKQPDYVLAAKIGVCKSVIARRRRELGIPSYAESTGHDGKIKKGEPHRRWNRG